MHIVHSLWQHTCVPLGEASAIVAKAVARSEGLGILGEALGAKV